MSDLFAVAGSKIFIGGVKNSQTSDLIATDFDSEVWVEIDGWEQMGGIGDASAEISTNLINRGRVTKQKGTKDAGTMENRFAILRTDPGQIALRAAVDPQDNYAFRILFDDQPSGGTSGTQKFFIGLAMSEAEVGGEANTVQMLSVPIGINSNIVTVAAA